MKSLGKYIYFVLFFWFLIESKPALANNPLPSIFNFTNGVPRAKIPFKFLHHMIVLPVTINGQHTFNFILDTGTRTPVMLHEKAIRHLNLPRGRNISFSGGGLKGVVSGFTIDGIRLSLPGVVANGISMVVLEKNYLHVNKLDGTEIHGIIGATLFRSFVVNIDYPNQVIHLIDKNTFQPCAEYTPIAMQIIDSKPVVQAELRIENKLYPANLMLDTGFNRELLLKTGTFTLPDSARHSRLGRGLGGTINGKTGKVDYLKLNAFLLQDVEAMFPTASSYPSDIRQMQPQGMIGNGLLKQYNIVFDYAGEMLYIKLPPLPVEKQPVPLLPEWMSCSGMEAFSAS